MGAADAVYNLFFKRSTLYIPFVLAGAFFANEGIDRAVNAVWESNNRGVRLLSCAERASRHAHGVIGVVAPPLVARRRTRDAHAPPTNPQTPPKPHRNCSRTCRRPRPASE